MVLALEASIKITFPESALVNTVAVPVGEEFSLTANSTLSRILLKSEFEFFKNSLVTFPIFLFFYEIIRIQL